MNAQGTIFMPSFLESTLFEKSMFSILTSDQSSGVETTAQKCILLALIIMWFP